jgi:hypothetical protein
VLRASVLVQQQQNAALCSVVVYMLRSRPLFSNLDTFQRWQEKKGLRLSPIRPWSAAAEEENLRSFAVDDDAFLQPPSDLAAAAKEKGV